MSRIVIAGGTGFIGQHLQQALRAWGCEVIVLSRSPGQRPDHVGWDGRTPGAWMECLNGVQAVINLAGKSVNCRHTPANQRQIVASRVDSVRAVGQAIQQCQSPPGIWIQITSLGYYGHVEDGLCDEITPPGEGFYARTTMAWEAAFNGVRLDHTRKVTFRVGLALHPDGGILKPLITLAQLGLAGRMGTGRQGTSWIHMADLARACGFALDEPGIEGVYNVTAPRPVSQADFMRALCHALKRPMGLPMPAPLLHVGAFVLGTTPHALLEGHFCVPRRLLDAGFAFCYPALGAALADLLAERSPQWLAAS